MKLIPKRCYWCGKRIHNIPLSFRKMWCDKLKENGISLLEEEVRSKYSKLLINYEESNDRILNETWRMKVRD